MLDHLVRRPDNRRYATPLLLLHGAWHGAWCWENALDDFARRGFEAHAFSLRAHGSQRGQPINRLSLKDYVADLAAAVAEISPRPVVVGHSLGGGVLEHFLSQAQLPGAVLLCALPASGALGFVLRWGGRHPWALTRALGKFDLLEAISPAALTREALFRPTLSDAELQAYAVQLGSESLRVLIDVTLRHAPSGRNRTPTLVIAAERDQVFTLKEQRKLAAAYAAELVVVPQAAHDLMLDSAWPVAADAIEAAVARWEQMNH